MTREAGRQSGRSGPHPRVPTWIGDVIAAVFIVASAYLPFPQVDFRPDSVFTFALVLAPALILPLRRRWPIAVLAACVAQYAAAGFTGTLWPGLVLAMAIAMFGATNRLRRRAALITTLVTIIVIIVINVLASLSSLLDLRAFAVVITVAFAAAAGDGARSGREYIAAITERAERAEESRESEAKRRVSEERLRIARDLHDAVAHQIAVISLNAGVASSAIPSRPDDAQDAVRTIRSAARTVLSEIGALLEVLRTDDDGPRDISPQPGLERLGDLVGQFEDAGLAVTIRIEGDLAQAETPAQIVAYRVIQEGLTNAHKHGAESRAHVLVRAGADTLDIVVTNPTLPVDTPHTIGRSVDSTGSTLGLIGLRERVTAARGTVETGPTPGGWRVAATLPLGTDRRP
ncbi:sensor histidine kinase [Microbacterium sp. NPDC056057]|uniref:sensor histidine kinase n=1 Tax=Microbacterium sp. NPDC056057 TaxID=3345699 RepID=UPI0035D67D24